MRARLALAEQQHLDKLLLEDPLRAHDAVMHALTPLPGLRPQRLGRRERGAHRSR